MVYGTQRVSLLRSAFSYEARRSGFDSPCSNMGTVSTFFYSDPSSAYLTAAEISAVLLVQIWLQLNLRVDIATPAILDNLGHGVRYTASLTAMLNTRSSSQIGVRLPVFEYSEVTFFLFGSLSDLAPPEICGPLKEPIPLLCCSGSHPFGHPTQGENNKTSHFLLSPFQSYQRISGMVYGTQPVSGMFNTTSNSQSGVRLPMSQWFFIIRI
ncbi:hypothetical protein B0H16DRAFT_685148 [Mycena metata]|uniref:Uncharacterized protein n=1 Tax=Mycena metata TaxID=1033252 RepID=A0AAD7GW24_9AGAR|nr:hypothetical protein B0H16DRAFT_685148 [Mycena metata]